MTTKEEDEEENLYFIVILFSYLKEGMMTSFFQVLKDQKFKAKIKIELN